MVQAGRIKSGGKKIKAHTAVTQHTALTVSYKLFIIISLFALSSSLFAALTLWD